MSSNTFRIAHFAAKLACETDASDVHRAQHEGTRFVLIDSRGDSAWAIRSAMDIAMLHLHHGDEN